MSYNIMLHDIMYMMLCYIMLFYAITYHTIFHSTVSSHSQCIVIVLPGQNKISEIRNEKGFEYG